MTETSAASATIEQGAPLDSGDPVGHVDQVVQYYGLTSDPFASPGDVFLLTPKIDKLLRLLNYLTRFSHKLIIVTADAGVGKTRVAEQFLQRVSGDRDYCQINGLADDTPVQILREIAEQVGLAELQSATVAELKSDLLKYAGDLLEDGRTCLILIDDADLLATPVLQMLHDLVQPITGEITPLHLVLFGRPQLEDNLTRLESLADDRHHEFHYQLSRFSFKECCQYLEICFAQAGDQARIPFSKADFIRIHQNSGGVPLEIVAEARRVLADGVNRLVSNNRPRKWMLSAAAGLSLVAAVFVASFFWQQRSGEQSLAEDTIHTEARMQGKIDRVAEMNVIEAGATNGEDQREAVTTVAAQAESDSLSSQAGNPSLEEVPEEVLAEVADQTIEAAAEIIETEMAEDAAPDSASAQAALVVQAPEGVGEISGEDSGLEPATAPEPEALAQPRDTRPVVAAKAAVPLPLDASLVVPAAGKRPVVAAAEAQPAIAAPAEQPVAPEVATHEDAYTAYSSSEQAILRISGSDYTLQLLGARTEQQILEFLAPYAGVEEYRYFQTELKGAPWYVVVYGNYPDRASATKAVASLPASLGVAQPWVRRMGGIQKLLRERSSPPQLSQQ